MWLHKCSYWGQNSEEASMLSSCYLSLEQPFRHVLKIWLQASCASQLLCYCNISLSFIGQICPILTLFFINYKGKGKGKVTDQTLSLLYLVQRKINISIFSKFAQRDQNQIIIFIKMGGCTGKSRQKPNSEIISQRDIVQEEQTPVHMISFVSVACGYGFQQIRDQQALKKHSEQLIKQKQIQKYNELSSYYIHLHHQYKLHKIDKCNDLIQKIEKLANSTNFELLEQIEEGQKGSILKFIKQVKYQHQEVISIEEEINQGGWIPKSEDKGISISSRRDGDSVAVLVETEIDVPVEIFLSVIGEFQLFSKFIPFMEVSECLRIIDRNHKIGFCVNNFPLLSKREVIFQGIGFNRLEFNDSIFLLSKSVHNRPEFCQQYDFQPPISKDRVQIEYKYFVVRYMPINRQRGKTQMIVNMDMKLNFIPMFILDFFSQKFCMDFFLNIVQIANKFEGSEWNDKMKKNPETFNFYKASIEEYLESKKKQQIKEEYKKEEILS